MVFGLAPTLQDERGGWRYACPLRRFGEVAPAIRWLATFASMLTLLAGSPARADQVSPGTPPENPAPLAPISQPAAPNDAATAPAAHSVSHPASPKPGLTRPTDAAASAASKDAPPSDLRDLSVWLDYRESHPTVSLPLEARVFYRRGLLTRQSGQREQAMRLVRGAAELDPSFMPPHLTLASWLLAAEPSQALLQYAAVLDLIRQSFPLQLELVANTLLLLLEALFLGLLAAGVIIVWLRQRELRHPWQEEFSRVLNRRSALVWSWVIIIGPYLLGMGAALPTVLLLGLAWPLLKLRERVVFIMLTVLLAVAPLVAGSLGGFSVALREDQGPFFGVVLLENQPASAERLQRYQNLALTHPDNPFLQFGLGWTERRGGDLATAEAGFRRALTAWPTNDRVLNDLGNVVAMRGRSEEALDLYHAAISANAENAAAHFNASQIYTQRFEYRTASDELTRASALNFEMVKSYQAQSTSDGSLPLVDEWIDPRTFWHALGEHGERVAALPTAWRARPECSGWRFSLAAVVAAVLGLVTGVRRHRSTPLRACNNCGTTLCRRCSERRRELALCPACSAVEARAESPEFARVLLLQHRRRTERTPELVRTALAAVIPGYGLLAFRRASSPVLLLAATAMLSRGWLGLSAPFAVEPRLALPGQQVPVTLVIVAWIALYAISLLTYFRQLAEARAHAAELAAPTRGRTAQVRRNVTPMAA